MQNIDEQQFLHFPSPSVRHWSITRVPWLQNSFTKLIQSKHKVQAGADVRLSTDMELRCGKILHSKKKQKSHHPMSDVMSECRANMDLSAAAGSSISQKHTPDLLCYPSFNAPPLHYCQITRPQISDNNNFSFLHDNSTSVDLTWMLI